MPKRGLNRWIHILMTAMLIISAIMSTGCSDYNSDYKRFALNRGAARFSFEYPRNYVERDTTVISGSSTVAFSRGEEDWDSYLWVRVYRAGMFGTPDAKFALESAIAGIASYEYLSNLEIIDRSPVIISGIKGEQVTLSYYYAEAEPDVDSGTFIELPATLIVRYTYFDYNGFIWEIRMRSTEEVAETDEAVWEHVLETFRILD